MSKLQKKKTGAEKKKKRSPREGGLDSAGSASVLSSSKSSVTGISKLRSEKAVDETKVKEPNAVQRGIEFLREVKMELKKVTWPTRKQTTGTTIVVIIFVFVVAGFLGLFDLGLSKLVQVVLT